MSTAVLLPDCEPVHDPSSPSRAGAANAEARLLAGLRAGDGRAYETLVRQFGGRMLAVARRYLPNHEDSADVVQDAFIAAYRGIHTFQGNSKLWTWLHRIVVNACLIKLRTLARRRIVPLDDLFPSSVENCRHADPVSPWQEEAIDSVARAETRSRVRDCIDRLPDVYRTVLHMRDIEELDTTQTAQALGVTRGTVKTRLHRARQALRTLLEPHFRVDS